MNWFSARAKCRVITAKAGIQSGLSPTKTAVLLAAALQLPAFPAAAEELGRLFFTPERRAALERQRQYNIRETQKNIEGAELAVTGVVQRSSGRNTAWINGQPHDERSADPDVRIQIDRSSPGKATVISGEETPASLKVGEALNRATRETTSGVGDGRIVVKRGGAPDKAR